MQLFDSFHQKRSRDHLGFSLANRDNCAIIDVGGQDTKVIIVENGMVQDFLMNDKCSAGTGRINVPFNCFYLQYINSMLFNTGFDYINIFLLNQKRDAAACA